MVIFKVQADRIQSNDETTSAWVAVKISAVWRTPPGAPTQADVDALLPWKWENLAGGAPWTPHDPDAWALWTIDPVDMRTARPIAAPLTVTAVSHHVVVHRLDARLDAAVTAITQSNGAIRPESLLMPDQQSKTDLAGTVLGFVERLASVPHPVPSAANVHALLEIGGLTRPGELDGLLIIAAPRVTSRPGQAFDARTINPVFEAPDPVNPDNFHWSLSGPNHSAELKSSRVVSAMRAAPANGRVLDLFDQTIVVVTNPLRTLPTADALAGLPQALADAIDPLSRLRSVLGEGLRDWIETPANATVLRADLGLDAKPDQPPPPSVLKRMLDAIAVQVLGARYDAVGRFEVPLVEALEAYDDPATTALLSEHINALPTGVNESPRLAAWRVDPGNVFGNGYAADAWARIAAASPFTRDHLLQLAGFDPAPSSSREGVKLETDVLREIWSHAAAVVPAQPGELRGIRYLELPREQLGAVGRPLLLNERFESVELPHPGTGAAPEVGPLADVSFERARASAALGFAAPFIEGIVSGRSDWSTALPGDVTAPLFQRLSIGLRTLLQGDGKIEGLYKTLAHQAATLAGITGLDPLFDLLSRLIDAAAEEAIVLGASLAPRIDPFGTVTQLPLPLSFQIDQLQTFSRHVDDWTRLAGYGLVARRTGTANETAFVSLNAARLYFGQGQQPTLPHDPTYLFEFESVYSGRDPISGESHDGTPREFIDPHPFAPGDQVGVSDAIAEYSNAWQTAPMPGQAALDATGGTKGVEAARFLYGPPGTTATKLPTLTFGRTYMVRAHLVGQGGVLAPFARHPNNPYVLRGNIADDAPGLTATIPYLRTVAVSGPSFSADTPPKPASVSLLADELPKRVPSRPLTTAGLRMNIDTARGLPRMACNPAADGGLRFEFVIDASGPTSFDLAIEAVDRQPHGFAVPVVGEIKGRWYRLDVFKTGDFVLRSRDVGIGTENEFRTNIAWVDVAQSQLAYQPSAVSLRLMSATSVDVEALRVVSIAGSLKEAVEVSESSTFDAPRAAPLLLDGLDRSPAHVGQRLSNGLVRSEARVSIDGPSIDRHTWERWVNCALFADGAPPGLKSRVATLLNRLQSEGAQTRTELADPAVSGLWVELWRVFPQRERIGAPLTFSSGADPLARPGVDVDIKVGAPDMVAGGNFTKDGDSKASAVGIAGHIYELRARAIIRRQDAPFDGLVRNEARFGPAVIEGFSSATQAGEALFLGPSSVLPIEIATAELPVLNVKQWKPDTVVPLRWEGSRRIVDLKLPSELFDGGDGGRKLLRYCASASLVPQHWTWRGRPDPKGPIRLFDRAFAQRRNSDHGSLETGALRVSHALSLEPGATPPPTIASRDLDWRGGWNLWRFGVRLTSRYRALFQTKADGLAVRDLHAPRPEWRWLERDVRDAANGRMIGKPPLVLVLPLTEAGADDGLVPPLLALIAEPMHVNGNFGDDIAVAVDVARHPLPAFKLNPVPTAITEVQKLKFLPEVGSDPVRTGAAHSGSAVALRLDGPIGYGFDLGSEAGSFTHSGYLVSPVRHRLEPWSMIKLKMRRIEWSGHDVPTEMEKESIAVRGVWPPGSDGLDPSPDRVPFDGLVVQELAYESGKPFVVAFHNDAGQFDGPAGQRLELTIVEAGNDWRVDASVLKVDTNKDSDWRLNPSTPNAGSFAFVRGSHRPSFRLIVSARARPEKYEFWTPSGEVMIQVDLGDGEVENGGNGWLTIFNLPIEAGHKESIANEPRVDLGVNARIERVRLSDFSPSIWCQFTVASSKIRIDRNGTAATVDVDRLDLKRPDNTPDNGWLSLIVHEGKMPRRMLPDVEPRAQDVPDMVEIRVAIFTEDAFDISHQVRERPVVALLLDDDRLGPQETKIVTRAKRVLWQDDSKSKPGRPGRWRLLRVLRRKDDEISDLGDLFAEPFDEVTNNPADGRGMVLTVSRPFPQRML